MIYNWIMEGNSEKNESQPVTFPKSEKIEPGSDGWLSPSGVFYEANRDQHKESADWIVRSNLSELKGKRGSVGDVKYMERSGLPSTQFLRDNGWILINGPVFRTDNALNYTTPQLTKLAEAGIPVVGAYDGSKEFSSKETLKWVNESAKAVSYFIDTQKPQILIGSWSGYKKVDASQEEFWAEIKHRGYPTLEDFKEDPFHTTFGDFGLMKFTDIRDVLTKGYQDEITFDYGMETYVLRLIELHSGEKICVEYTFHHHDGLGSGNEEHMNVYVVDNFTFKEKIKKYLSSGVEPDVKGEYFRNIIEG